MIGYDSVARFWLPQTSLLSIAPFVIDGSRQVPLIHGKVVYHNVFCCFCGEGELVGGVHTLVGGVVQVYHVLPELVEEDKGREEVHEIEKENQGEENAQMTMHMWMT